MMDKLLFAYADTFGENFPLFMVNGLEEKEIQTIIQKCLNDGIPYEPDTDERTVY